MDLPLFFTLPLIGGFAFVTGFFLLRWRSARQDTQRLYYRAAVWGGTLAVGAAIGHVLLLALPGYGRAFAWLQTEFLAPLLATKDLVASSPSATIRHHVALVCIYAGILGIGLPPVFNLLLKVLTRQRRAAWLVELNLSTISDPLEKALSRSLVSGEPVQLTLATGKVYVGYVLEGPDPGLPTKFIKFQPLMSGQRSGTGQVEYTTFYDKILADLDDDPATKAAVRSFEQVVPVDKVVTLSGFNLDAYVRFLAERQEREEEASPQAPATSQRGISSNAWLAVAAFAAARLLR